MTKGLRFLALTIVLMGMELSAHAHPGHSALSKGAQHFLTSPFHILSTLALGAGLWIGAVFIKNGGAKIALRAGGTVALLAALWAVTA
jgi:hypothetical protein